MKQWRAPWARRAAALISLLFCAWRQRRQHRVFDPFARILAEASVAEVPLLPRSSGPMEPKKESEGFYDKRAEAPGKARRFVHHVPDGASIDAGCHGDAMSRRTDARCSRDCPNRKAVPNCHNEETCPIWAEHMAKKRALEEARARAKAADDDATAVAVNCSRRIAKERKRHRCKN